MVWCMGDKDDCIEYFLHKEIKKVWDAVQES